MNKGQGHVGEAIVDVDPLVDKDDADRGEEVDQEAGGNALVGRKTEQSPHHGYGGFLVWPAPDENVNLSTHTAKIEK